MWKRHLIPECLNDVQYKIENDLNLDDTIKGLIGDKCLVTDVQLEQSCGVGPVQDSFI